MGLGVGLLIPVNLPPANKIPPYKLIFCQCIAYSIYQDHQDHDNNHQQTFYLLQFSEERYVEVMKHLTFSIVLAVSPQQ